MKSWACAAVLVSMAAAAACGGNVVVDPEGKGGAGGTTTSSTTTSTTSSTTTTSPTTTTATQTTSDVAPFCDGFGVCGDVSDPSTCLGCAIEGDCADELAACQNSQECIDFVTCIDPCADAACFDACAAMFPNGATFYNDLVFCAICEQCPVSCDGPSSGCP